MAIFDLFTPAVERVSIDEAFLDVAGSVRLFGPPAEIADKLRRRVRSDVGLAISVGVASTKHLAKIASQVAKPDGLVVVEPGTELAFLDPLPVGLLWGIGPVAQAKLAALGIHRIGQLSAYRGATLEHLFGTARGSRFGSLATNVDDRAVVRSRRASSVGAQSALGRAEPTATLLRTVLGHLADRVTARLRASRRAGRTITTRIRFVGMRSVTRSRTLPEPVASTLTVLEVAEELVRAALADHPSEAAVTLLGISVSKLIDQPAVQQSLPLPGRADARRPTTQAGADRWAIDLAMDAIRDRYGARSVGYASIAMSEHGSMPDEFRELAEHTL